MGKVNQIYQWRCTELEKNRLLEQAKNESRPANHIVSDALMWYYINVGRIRGDEYRK